MENLVVHRIVEQYAAARGDLTALDHDGTSLTYRELNVRANGIARQLLDAGFRRGGHLLIASPHGLDLATMLFAVLKAGGAYTWRAPESLPWRAAFAGNPDENLQMYRPLDVESILQMAPRTSPNLPVLTRPSDVACVLRDTDRRQVLVPHSTIAALRREPGATATAWSGEPSTFDLWAGLMSGSTVSIRTTALPKAA
jgi:non-ribosomal peptide synthetase component F